MYIYLHVKVIIINGYEMLMRHPSGDAELHLDIQVGILGKIRFGYIHFEVTSL